MESLFFQNPVFRTGLNVTVRLGDKWANKVKPNDVVILSPLIEGECCLLSDNMKVEDCKLPATIVGILQTTFEYIPLSLLEYEHDPNAKTVDGLFKVMNELYPECTLHSIVTVLLFKI